MRHLLTWLLLVGCGGDQAVGAGVGQRAEHEGHLAGRTTGRVGPAVARPREHDAERAAAAARHRPQPAHLPLGLDPLAEERVELVIDLGEPAAVIEDRPVHE